MGENKAATVPGREDRCAARPQVIVGQREENFAGRTARPRRAGGLKKGDAELQELPGKCYPAGRREIPNTNDPPKTTEDTGRLPWSLVGH